MPSRSFTETSASTSSEARASCRWSIVNRDPATAAAVVNTLINDYLDQYFQTRYTATHQASEWLAGQLDDLKGDVETSQQRLADYQKQTGILGESETNNVVMAKLEDLNRQFSAAQANRIVKQAVWQLARTGDPELISSVAGSSFVQGVSRILRSSACCLASAHRKRSSSPTSPRPRRASVRRSPKSCK